MFMCEPRVLWKWVSPARGNQADVVCHYNTLFANCHNALHPDLNCCLQVITNIKVDIFWVR